jgi:hypothetical protein
MTFSARIIAFVASLGLVSLTACGRTVTPAELQAYEDHSYDGQSKADVFRATIIALKSLGYEIVDADAARGHIKTAPKLMVVQAARTSSTTAMAVGSSVAWTIDVSPSSGGAALHALPRLYRAGESVDPNRLNADFADRTFSTLYAEIESNLTSHTTTTSATPADKAASKKTKTR